MRAKLYRGSWYAVWTENGQTKRIALRTKDRAVAEQRLADLNRQSTGPLDSIADIYEAYCKEKAPGLASFERIPGAWKVLKPHFGSLRPDQVTRLACRNYAKARKCAGRKDGTILKELSLLRAILRWHDPRTPAVFEMPPAPPPRDRHLSRREYGQLLDACRAPHVRLFVLLALATAARSMALLELTWGRVDFKRGLINLGGKQGKKKGRATVPMTETVRGALEEALRAARTDFVIEYADKPIKQIRRAFTATCKRAGLKNVSPHVLRHTAAVWMAESRVPMSEISAFLGHADSRITERVYARFSPEYLRRAAAALEG